MTSILVLLSTLAVLLPRHALGDFEHLISKPESLVLARGYETLLSCEMNIEPDRFQWKFYPSDRPYDDGAYVALKNATFEFIPATQYRVSRRKSELTVQVKNEKSAGDYQCLAYYGAAAVASTPWRITLARLGRPPEQQSVLVSVLSGNTVSWRCDVPDSNPAAYVDYSKGDKYVTTTLSSLGGRVRSLILANVSVTDAGTYKCATTNTFEKIELAPVLQLEVVRNSPPKPPAFLTAPLVEYTATRGSNLFLECAAHGSPVPKVTWSKKRSILPVGRAETVPGGLLIRDVTSSDDGVYVCRHSNYLGELSHEITVKYNEEPSIDCGLNTTDIKQGENMDLMCYVKGTPEPQIAWFLNGFSVLNDSTVEAVENKIYFRQIHKRHAGNLQVFARNAVKTVYSSISIRVIPLSSNMEDTMELPVHSKTHSKKLKSKMLPPSKPVISRANDETVVVRWNMTSNESAMPVQWFKVQHMDMGPINHTSNQDSKNAQWITSNTVVPPTITSLEVNSLQPEHVYKFRVFAIFVNEDSKMSKPSKKFHLRRLDFNMKNPLPICLITNVETVNHTAIKIYWQCPEYSNVTVDGFYINYIVATRAGDDYLKLVAEGNEVRNFVINHLQPETSYDITIQSYNRKEASERSPAMQGRTAANPLSLSATTPFTTSKSGSPGPVSNSNVYIVVVGTVIGLTLAISGTIFFFVCRKWQKKKLSDGRDNGNIQVDGNDYVVEPKSAPRTNGCALAPNRITITANPLADADKNPTVIEMRNLANNNVRPPSSPRAADGAERPSKHRSKTGVDSSRGNNYV